MDQLDRSRAAAVTISIPKEVKSRKKKSSSGTKRDEVISTSDLPHLCKRSPGSSLTMEEVKSMEYKLLKKLYGARVLKGGNWSRKWTSVSDYAAKVKLLCINEVSQFHLVWMQLPFHLSSGRCTISRPPSARAAPSSRSTDVAHL